MALTIQQADAANTLCSYLLGAHRDEDKVPSAVQACAAAAELADGANQVLVGGWNGAEIHKRWGIGLLMSGDDALTLLDLLAKYSGRIGRQCEVILRSDGSGELTGKVEPGVFTQIARFGSLDELRRLLEAQ